MLLITLNRKKHLGIFLDLSKAFGTICHSKLLVKLQNYAIRGNCLELIKSYLSSRKQITKFDDVMSDAENILFGVPVKYNLKLKLKKPQGSVLGHLLFLIYINDVVHSSTQGEFVIFADDTNIFIAVKTKKEAYNVSKYVLRSIYAYMHANQLHINLSKCAHMYFRPNLNYRDRMKCARSECYDPTIKRQQYNKMAIIGWCSSYKTGVV